MWLPLLLASVLACVALDASLPPSSTSSYLSAADKSRLKKVIETGFQLTNLPGVHYAVIGYNIIGEPIPKSAVSDL